MQYFSTTAVLGKFYNIDVRSGGSIWGNDANEIHLVTEYVKMKFI